ncbi:hypothetical protein SB49_10845 [Sediminicola sp. YIK13]|nr:hypothetical protein SB49_10845 [Sediminicola sp. YIK13]
MRITEFLLTLLISQICFGQARIVGVYNDRFSESIELKADSTFTHNYKFDLASSWTTGKWKFKNGKISLQTKLIMDTLVLGESGQKKLKDSLVLSPDKVSNRVGFSDYAISSISGGGQNRVKPPSQLYWKKKRLYRINEDGTLDLRKLKGFWTDKKYKTYFRKETE